MYDADAYSQALAANVIADNLFDKFNEQGRQHIFLGMVIDFRSNYQEVNEK